MNNIYKLTKANKLPELIKFILIYSCCVGDTEKGIALNQEAIAKFLKRSERNIVRHFNILKDEKFITVVDKVKLHCASTRENKDKKAWYSNLYVVDQEAMNTYLIKVTKEDILANIEEESKMYNDFMTQVYANYVESKMALEATLTEAEKAAIARRVARKTKREQKKLNELKSINLKYLELLKDINYDASIKMSYLDENKKRLTSVLCGTKNPEKHTGSTERMDMLHKFFESDSKIVEFDTNASIYRLSYSLGNGCSASHDVDLYELIYKECGFDAEWNQDLRDKFKQLLMPIYMREWSINFKCLEFKKQSHWKKFISKQTEEVFKFNKYFVDLLKLPLKDILNTVCAAMHRVFNLDKFYKAEIFIHESNLHILMCKKFKDMGIQTIDVYDGFYFIEGTMTKELFNTVYDEATLELLEDYGKDVEAA